MNTINIPSIANCKTQEERDELIRKIAMALGASMKWEIYDAKALAARLLAEVNAHDEAAMIRATMNA